MARVAALVAGFQRRLRNLPGPSRGASIGGVPFLTDQFPDGRVIVEAAFGANLTGSPDAWPWVDITADVRYASRLRLRVGRADDTSQAQAASCGFDLDNTSGDYSAYNPASRYYPNVRRNTPIRVRVDLGSGPSVVWQGYAVGWKPSWDTSANVANVTVTAAGVLQRLSQGNSPLRSALYRVISNSTGLVAYWPMEDGSDAASAAQVVTGQAALQPVGTAPVFGSTGPPGSAAAVDVTNGGFLSAPVSGCSATAWSVEFSMKLATTADPGLSALQRFIQVHTTGTEDRWQLGHSVSGGPSLLVYQPNNLNDLFLNDGTVVQYDGAWHNYVFTAAQSGSDIAVVLYVDDVSVASGTITGATLGPVVRVTLPAATGNYLASGQGSVAHVVVYNGAITPSHAGAVSGWAGETADTRITRMCAEEGVLVDVVGTSTTAMGAQPISAFVDILRECETADGGVMFDGFGSKLGYLCRSTRYNLPATLTIDVSAGQLSPPFAPVDDDQRTRNDVTVSRATGQAARYIATDGPLGTDAVGTYDTSVEVNTETDSPLLHIAAWLARLGTVEGLRYPTLPLDFATVPVLAQPWINAAAPAFRVDVTNIDTKATQHPPDDVSLVVEGWSMDIDQMGWDVTASCSQYAPWRVATVNGTDLVIGSSASRLATDLAPAATGAVSVTVTRLWSTSGADYPVDLNIGGERVTCSGVSGGSSPQTFTISARSVNGVVKAHAASETVDVWNPARVAR